MDLAALLKQYVLNGSRIHHLECPSCGTKLLDETRWQQVSSRDDLIKIEQHAEKCLWLLRDNA